MTSFVNLCILSYVLLELKHGMMYGMYAIRKLRMLAPVFDVNLLVIKAVHFWI